MAATFIPVTISDFEKHFDMPDKRNPERRAFELIEPDGEEAFYFCDLYANDLGVLSLKVYTSIKAGNQVSREVGKDAIRVCLVWHDADGWSAGVGRMPRVNRAGGKGRTSNDIVKRALERAREVAKTKGEFPTCPKCGRPMTLRKGSLGKFWGCVGFGRRRANCNGTRQHDGS